MGAGGRAPSGGPFGSASMSVVGNCFGGRGRGGRSHRRGHGLHPSTGPTTRRRAGDILQGGGLGPGACTTNRREHRGMPLPKTVSLRNVVG